MIGLTVTEKVAGKKGTMIKPRECIAIGGPVDGKQSHEVIIEFYENVARFKAKDLPLTVRDENKRIRITVPEGTEMNDSNILLYLKHPLAQVYTLAEES